MPVTYGHPDKPVHNVSTDIEQYTKWFDLMGIDFDLWRTDNSWICNAWSRGKNSTIVASSGKRETLGEALHKCYSEIRFYNL